MAKTSFTYSCGHAGIVMGRNRAEADRTARYRAQSACWECQKTEENAAAKASADAQGLPELVGTPKQVPYAVTLRARLLPILIETIQKMRDGADKIPTVAQRTEWLDALTLLEKEYREISSAKWWIEAPLADHGQAIIDEIAEEIVSRRLAPTVILPVDNDLREAARVANIWWAATPRGDAAADKADGAALARLMRRQKWATADDVARLNAILTCMGAA